MYLLALRLAELRGTLAGRADASSSPSSSALPQRDRRELLDDGRAGRRSQRSAERHWQADFFLYLGRHVGLPVALEGALKLKEISYIATDAYAAGEMKHGPIALLDESTPVVCVATDSPVLDKIVSNMQEVARPRRARDRDRDRGQRPRSASTPRRSSASRRPTGCSSRCWRSIPLQLLAYAIARLRGLNVDQPRNLAKTVTVE